MTKTQQTLLSVLALAPILVLLLGLTYAYQRARFTQRVNATFDPQEKAFHGIFLPRPVGCPTLAGGLVPETDRRIRSLLDLENAGTVRSNGMTLILHASDGTFLVHAD